MQLHWTLPALQDLQAITRYLFEQTPGNAAELVRRIHVAPIKLLELPGRGRPGRIEGTRELLVARMPYVVVYRVRGEQMVEVLRLIHTSQNWPENRTIP